MEKRMRNLKKEVWQYFLATIIFLAYSAKYDFYEFDGAKFRFRRTLNARFYSPVFWAMLIFTILLTFFISLWVDGIREWIVDLKYHLRETFKNDNGYRTMSNEFRPEVPAWERKVLLWRYTYWD